MKIKVLILFFAIAIVLAKVIAGMEAGFLIAVTMMAVGVVVAEKTGGGMIALIGTMTLFFNMFSMPLPPHAFPVVYIIIALSGLLMVFTAIVIMAVTEEEKTTVTTNIGHMPDRRKAITA